jgi:hypothetical protein
VGVQDPGVRLGSGRHDFEDRDTAKCPVRQQYVVGEWLLTHELLKQRPLHVKVTAGIERHLTQHGLDGLSLLLAHAPQHHIRPGEAASLNPDESLTPRRRRARRQRESPDLADVGVRLACQRWHVTAEEAA